MTLLEAVTGWLEFQKNKHDLRESYVEDYINNLTQYEFLESLSEALENLTPVNIEDPTE